MDDLMNAYGWEIDKQSFLRIPGTIYLLSVIPEYTYWFRNEHGMIARAKTPQGIKLNCLIQKPYESPEGTWYKTEMMLDITSEDEFYDFMIGMKQEFGPKSEVA